MELVRLDSLAPTGWPSPTVTIGNFDGVHRGHRALVEAALSRRPQGGTVVALTFDPHPARLLTPDRAPRTLTTVEQKAELLHALGVDRLAVLPFTEELSRRTPDEFAREVLVGAVGARRVVVGQNFRFGHDRSGGVGELTALGRELDFGVQAVPAVLHDGRAISSSRIRAILAAGAVDEAWTLLGHPYFVDGSVVEGERRGRTLGFPTANVQTENEVLPAPGVYAARCRVASGEWWGAVANLGRRPTFGGERPSAEAFLIDFQGDLYRTRLRLEFQARLRDEKRFPGPEALVEQIRRDVEASRGLVANPRGKV